MTPSLVVSVSTGTHLSAIRWIQCHCRSPLNDNALVAWQGELKRQFQQFDTPVVVGGGVPQTSMLRATDNFMEMASFGTAPNEASLEIWQKEGLEKAYGHVYFG